MRAHAPRVLGMLGLIGSTLVVAAAPLHAADQGWPREVEHPKAKIVVYQPQFDKYEGTRLEGRSAVAVTTTGAKKPVFGAAWFAATAHIDRENRIVTFSDFDVPRVRFPDATEAQQQELTKVLEDAIPKWDNTLSYDRFIAAVAAITKETEEVEKLRNDPPQIVVENEPAMLVTYDGEPELREIEGTKLKRVVNTPSVVIFDTAGKRYWLYGGTAWLSAPAAAGPFKLDPKPPKEIAQIGTQIEKSAAEAAKQKGEVLPQDDERVLAEEAKKENPKLDPTKPPKVITATEPTELVVFDGEPDYSPLVEGEILYVKNTANDVLMEVASQQHYLLISGRWYRSKAWSGPWTYVRGDQLPATFKKIPESSIKGHLLASVAGTPQAEEALADAQIPQVAEVKRGAAQLDIKYDGEPQFEKIKGTSIEYAKNTPNQILKIEGKYYACEQGIWYVSDGAKGPWQVADKVPAEVQKIPPDSPAYNTKYVYVYDSTPEVVYVGYTQPYLGCYPYYGTVVWGTGYPYVPWVGAVYYPRPVTFGFHAHYNPYTGWSFGLSMGWSFGWGTISIGFWGGGGYYPPYWGPGGYYPAYRPPYYPVHHPPHYPGRPMPGPYDGRGQAGNRPSQLPAGGGGASASQQPAGGAGGARPSQQPAGGGPSASQQPAGGRSSNLYDRPANKDKVASTPDRSRSELSTRPSQGGGGKNNVFADEAGNVYRKGSGGQWEQRVGDGWQKTPQAGTRPSQGGGSGARPSNPSAGTRPSNPSAGTRPSAPSQSVQRDYNSRQRGSQRSSGYSGYGGSYGGGYRGGGGARGGGGMRGGGGRR